MMNRTSAVVLVGLFVAAGCLATGGQQTPAPQGAQQQAGSKPDFSGTWVFQPDRSSLESRVPDSSIFTIDHQDPHWHIERTHVFGGREDTLGFELLTDGVPVVREIRGVELHMRLHWEEDTLVFESSYTQDGEETNVVVRYRLADEGRTFIAEERMEEKGDSHRNTWVFERQ